MTSIGLLQKEYGTCLIHGQIYGDMCSNAASAPSFARSVLNGTVTPPRYAFLLMENVLCHVSPTRNTFAAVSHTTGATSTIRTTVVSHVQCRCMKHIRVLTAENSRDVSRWSTSFGKV